MTDLMLIQERIEKDMVVRGRERFDALRQRAENAGDSLRSRPYRVVLDAALEPLALGIERFLNGAAEKKVGRRIRSALFMAPLPSEALAYIALATILERAPKGPQKATALAERIGRAVEVELIFEKKRQDDPERAFHERQRLAQASTTTHRKIVAKHFAGAAEKAGGVEGWAASDRVGVGLKLIELVIETTGLFLLYIAWDKKRSTYMLRPSDGFAAWVDGIGDQLSNLFPTYAPTVVPPKDWTELDGGGYLTDALPVPLRFVKTSDKDHLAILRGADLTVLMAAVNAIQRTPWQVNARVLQVARELLESGRPVAGLPDMLPTPLPTPPVDFNADPGATARWKREAAAVYAENAKAGHKRLTALNAVAMASDFESYERIYFPHQCDTRGRIYPVPSRISPQGNDLQRALIRFADGYPLLTEEGARWFEIHGANLFGEVDKDEFPARTSWVSRNAEHIIASARYPLDYGWWMGADKPFAFLAWCFEYEAWQGEGFDLSFISRVPVAMDGSCNGIQHYSAMLLDPRGGKATNLVPGKRPEDFYAEVAAWVRGALENLEDPMAAHWARHGIDRGICKGPCIGFIYGGTRDGIQSAIIKHMDDLPPASRPFPPEHLARACRFLAGVMWDGITAVAEGAARASQWLREVAGAASSEGLPLDWTTPSGFPARLSMMARKEKRIELVMFGKRVRSSLREATDKLDRRRQGQAFPPYYVHGMDAGHLVLTVNASLAEGISQFAMIHDSYGCPAGQAPKLARILREEFIRIYQGDPLRALKEHLEDTLGLELPDPPKIGGLKLAEIVRSEYFFA